MVQVWFASVFAPSSAATGSPLAGSSGGTRNSDKKCQLLGVNFDQFMTIFGLKIKKQKNKKKLWRSEIQQEVWDGTFKNFNSKNFLKKLKIYNKFSSLSKNGVSTFVQLCSTSGSRSFVMAQTDGRGGQLIESAQWANLVKIFY